MDCPECGLEIAACPRCGASLKEGAALAPGGLAPTPGGESAPEAGLTAAPAGETVREPGMLIDGEEHEGAPEAAGPVKPRRSRTRDIPWPIVSGALALLLVSFIAIVLAVALIPWDGKDDPEGAVDSFLAAFGENRKADMVEMYDPEELADYGEKFGISVEEIKSGMAQSDAMEGTTITFHDLTYTATIAESAVVEVTSGTATLTDADGETTTEDMAGAQFELVKRDGHWYLKMPDSSGQY